VLVGIFVLPARTEVILVTDRDLAVEGVTDRTSSSSPVSSRPKDGSL
jgi:hypothetical protein